MEEYPGNSNSAKPTPKADSKRPEKQIQQITTNSVTRRKKPIGKRIAENLLGGDTESVGSYIASDVVLPAVKDMIADAVSQGVERILFGDSTRRARPGKARNTGGANSHVSYNRYSGPANRQRPADPRTSAAVRATRTDYEEIVVATRAEAAEVLDNLVVLVDEYDSATVADLYGMVGQTSTYVDEKWGWYDMRGSSVTRVKGGYLLDLPKPEPID